MAEVPSGPQGVVVAAASPPAALSADARPRSSFGSIQAAVRRANGPTRPPIAATPSDGSSEELQGRGQSGNGGQSVPKPDGWRDFALEGFHRIDGSDRPKRISQAAWDGVFPPDRPRALRLAGRFFLQGVAPDVAITRAAEDVAAESLATGPLRDIVEQLSELFPAEARRAPLEAACLAVGPTARRSREIILSDPKPERSAFFYRTWRARPGHCIVCGGKAAADDRRLRPSGCQDQGDALHLECLPTITKIGPAWGRLVLAECKRLEENPPAWPVPVVGDPSADPDDWSSYAD